MTLYYYLNQIERQYGKEEVQRAVSDGVRTYEKRSGKDIASHISEICCAHFDRLQRAEKAQKILTCSI